MIIDFEYANRIGSKLQEKERRWRVSAAENPLKAEVCNARADGIAEARRDIDLMILTDKSVTS